MKPTRYEIARDDFLDTLYGASVGTIFRDLDGRRVRKISDTDIVVGPGIGINSDMTLDEYASAIVRGETYGGYVLPSFDAREHFRFLHNG